MGEGKRKMAHYTREKVPLQRGYSLMDWNRLCNSGQDLTGTRGQILRVTMSEVKKHRTEDDAWLVLNGRVFNVTHYMKYHPGGVKKLMAGVGKDSTSLFNKTHAWVNWESLLAKCFVGLLIPEPAGSRKEEEESDDDLDLDAELDQEQATMFPAPDGPQRAQKS